MSARRTARWALHWAVITTAAVLASMAAAVPFTGPAAQAVGVLAAAAVCLIGIACAPHPGGARR
ncbi:hypothetical protein [Streptomyces sp. NRRL S-1022]|uniref:hypothetical protein n=1 Tax=Streptomyces sp. NRRL S-1022 TaxID=1463880 RepID=UPI0004C0DA36|nr:hypothetical protein [Streptomyces sp. NRRL S-1022]